MIDVILHSAGHIKQMYHDLSLGLHNLDRPRYDRWRQSGKLIPKILAKLIYIYIIDLCSSLSFYLSYLD